MTTWKVRTLRLTVFLASEAAHEVEQLGWQDLLGAKPESTMTRGDQQFQEGPVPPGRLLLQTQPGRLDVVYAGVPQADQVEEPVATLGEFEPAYGKLRPIALRVFDAMSNCVRLALGAEMVRPAQDSIAAYKILVEHIGSAVFKLDGGQEFVYQINRPRESKVIPSLLINRLMRWNASSWQPVRLELGAGVRVLSDRPHIGAVLTTDVNTDGERLDPIPSDKCPKLFDEIRDLTLEIRDKGDVG